jgi:hypothetical protein
LLVCADIQASAEKVNDLFFDFCDPEGTYPNKEKQQTFPNNDFSDEDFKLAAVDVLYSIQHYSKTGEQIFCARETTQHMIRVAQNQIQ